MGSKERSDGVGIFVAEKWVDSIVSIERLSKSTDFVNGLTQWFIKCLCFMLLTWENRRRKKSFWNEMFHLVSCMPQNEMAVLADDMNGHVGSSDAGYDGTHGGFGYGDRNADGSRILKFADRLNLVICNTLFMKQEFQLMAYACQQNAPSSLSSNFGGT